MATRKTQEEIAAEVAALKALVGHIRPQSAFGDDNNAALQVQIRVLERDLSDDEIYDRYEDDQNKLDAALEARQWAVGEEQTAPHEGWEGLRQ